MKNKYLDLGIKENNPIFLPVLIYLNEKGYAYAVNMRDELCVSIEEINKLYEFQSEIGYIGRAFDKGKAVYYLNERGIEACNFLTEEMRKVRKADTEYKKYVKRMSEKRSEK
mgnify:FL=1